MARLGIRFERANDCKRFCFRHAVQVAQAGIDVEVEIEEGAGGEQDMRQQYCEACAQDENKLTGGVVCTASKGPAAGRAPVAKGVKEFCEIITRHAVVEAELVHTHKALERVFGALGVHVTTPAGMRFSEWLVTGGTEKMVERIKILREGE